MKKFTVLMLCLLTFSMQVDAKKEKQQKKEKPAKTVKTCKDVLGNSSYTIEVGGLTLAVDSATKKMVSTKSLDVKAEKKNKWQQFVVIPSGNCSYYLYSVGAQSFVGKKGELTASPLHQYQLLDGKKKKTLMLAVTADSVWQRGENDAVKVDSIPAKGSDHYVTLKRVGDYHAFAAFNQLEDKTYRETTQLGLFNIKKEGDNKWFWDIPDSLLGRRFLLTVRFTGTPAATSKYGGELVKQQTVYWEVAPNGNLLLRSEALVNMSDTSAAINRAVEVSSINPIIASFKVESHKKSRYRINATPLFEDDNAAFGFTNRYKSQFGLAFYNANLSYIEGMKTFPNNTEVRAVKTWTSSGSGTVAGANSGKVTIGVNYSFVLLPKVPMQRRFFDPRVGYFADRFVRFSDNQQRVESENFIVRYRLEPKDSADAERMKKGELVEPKKQIVYYIDPATPKQWRKYLILGVNDWQKAFEKAGFKNAIVGKEWPENDPTMSMEDARYSVIRYLASDIANAYGPNVHDPRTGEILESHICWYHNVMKLLHDWYMVQAGTIDEAARKMNFDEELMGELIRFVSSHEVGHSLGLRHNFGSSSTVPVDSLRNKAWVEKNGHTPSIMDYARFNYVAQPEDGISREGIFPRINDYDCWAIEWGYRPMFAENPFADYEALEALIKEKHDGNPRLWFGDGETNRTNDSRCQTEDLGDDAIKASEYGILNLKRALKNLPEWSYDKKDIYANNLKEVYDAYLTQLLRYTNHVIRNLGGVYADFKTVDQDGAVYTNVSRQRQKEVMDYVKRHISVEPKWLIQEDYVKRMTPDPQTLTVRFGRSAVSSLLARVGGMTEEYADLEYLTDLRKMFFTEAGAGTKVSSYRKALQSQFVSGLCSMVKTQSSLSSARAAALQTLRQLKQQISNAGADVESRAHFSLLTFEIEKALTVK